MQLALLTTLPFTALQVLCAWWSTWLESTLDEDMEIGHLPFSSHSTVPCPGDPPNLSTAALRASPCALPPRAHSHTSRPSTCTASARVVSCCRCISCKYSFSSLVVHLLLTGLFFALIATFGRALVSLCRNAAMRGRIRLLYVLLPTFQLLQVAAAAAAVVSKKPQTWPHEVAKFIALVCVVALIVSVTVLLVILPLRSASKALSMLEMVRLRPLRLLCSCPVAAAYRCDLFRSSWRRAV